MISVCVAVHNGEKFIKEQLDSILCQLGSDDEIVISDDGSVDRTIAILDRYHDKRIRVFNYVHTQKYRYTFDYATHNFANAIQQAKGDIIFLADQDDVWLPNKVERVMANMYDCDILLHGKIVVDEHKNVIRDFSMPRSGFFRNIISCTTTGCCTAFNRKILKHILPFPQSGVGHDFWIGVYGGLYYKRKFLQEPLILFRRHGNNVTPSDTGSSNPISMRLRYRVIMLWAIVSGFCKVMMLSIYKSLKNI